VPSADKRQRKKENARMAREARESEAKKRKRNRTIRNGVIAVAVFAIAIGVITYLQGRNNNKSNVAVSPTTTSTPTTVATNTKGCDTTKPPSSAKDQSQSAPAMKINPAKTYTAVISTSCGDMKVDLDAKNSPKGVNNFVFLARQGFFDGLSWHRVAKDFVIQGGDPKGDGTGGPGYSTVTELPKDGYPLGTLAYAKTSDAPAGSAGSQFFIVTSDRPASLEQKTNGSYQYGAFGRVVSGLPVLEKLASFAPASGDGAPTQPIYIKKVTITEK
jgi:cyclophilin family peptidyl-prolyl cis-trans isomerase